MPCWKTKANVLLKFPSFFGDHGNCDLDLRKEIKASVKILFFYQP